MAFLNRGLTIALRDERGTVERVRRRRRVPAGAPREDRFHYAGGIEDFVRHLNASKTPAHKLRDRLLTPRRQSATRAR